MVGLGNKTGLQPVISMLPFSKMVVVVAAAPADWVSSNFLLSAMWPAICKYVSARCLNVLANFYKQRATSLWSTDDMIGLKLNWKWNAKLGCKRSHGRKSTTGEDDWTDTMTQVCECLHQVTDQLLTQQFYNIQNATENH